MYTYKIHNYKTQVNLKIINNTSNEQAKNTIHNKEYKSG